MAGSKIVALLKRHRRFITLLGTVIVLFTFIIRDILREAAHGKKETYESVKQAYATMEVLINISDRVRHVLVVIESQKQDYVENAHTLKESTQLRLDELNFAVANVRRVIEALPKSRISVQAAKLDQLREQGTNVINKMAEPIPPGTTDPRSFYEQQVKEVKVEQEKRKALGDSTLEVLGSEADKASKDFDLFNTWSIALYIVGVVVAAAAQLGGAEAETPDR